MKKALDSDRLDKLVAEARTSYAAREQGYRQLALKLYPWVCGRCMREFERHNVNELTVHHRDHDHDNNPADGSNWELLCVFCHDNEHQRLVEQVTTSREAAGPSVTHSPFDQLKALMERDDKP